VSWSALPDGGDQTSPRLSRGAVDRAVHLRTDLVALQQLWADGKVRLLRLGPGAMLPLADGPRLRWEEPLPWQEIPVDAWVLGQDADGTVRLAVLEPEVLERDVLELERTGRSLVEVGADLSDDEAALATSATALAQWHVTHRFCPADGAETVVSSGGWARACPTCGTEHFPRTDPAVIVLVTDPAGERAILGRAPHWPAGRFSCLAGFVEAGESAEQCVVREVLEEAGLLVRTVRPVVSQPWPFPRSLMLGYRATADADAAPVSRDGELAEVAWFSRDDVRSGVVKVPPSVSVAHHLIAAWLAEG
jgi:NAD+ diphosphatase